MRRDELLRRSGPCEVANLQQAISGSVKSERVQPYLTTGIHFLDHGPVERIPEPHLLILGTSSTR